MSRVGLLADIMSMVSVIVPVYNAKHTLKRCIDSIAGQTLQDVEVILVDDGSTDGSGQECDKYAENDKRIQVIHKENGGLVSARKAGVRAAKGKYIGYVDSDDWIEPCMYESLYDIAVKDDADMVCSGYILEGNYISKEYDTIPEGCYTGDKRRELLDSLIFNMNERDLGLRGSLCCKLFRREMIETVQEKIPDEISYSEDKLCVLTFALECKCISVVRQAWYHYIINNASMTQAPNTDYLSKVNAVYKYLVSLYSHPDFSDNMRAQAELYITQILIKGINNRMGFSVKNLMWIDDDWVYKVPKGSRVLLIGAGGLCETYERQVRNSDALELSGTIEEISEAGAYDFDYIVITYKYRPKAEEIRKALIASGIPRDKVLWFEQKEIFWKYAEYAGLCGRQDL